MLPYRYPPSPNIEDYVMIRSKFVYLIGFLAFSLVLGTMTSCGTAKEGCPMNDSSMIGAKTNRKGQYSKKGGKSSLFPKEMSKKKKRGK